MLNEINLARIDLNLLVLFEAVLETRHIGRAADRLHLSASAVSHGLARLRRVLNDPLFLKHPKGVVPTERAAALAEPVARILAEVRELVGSADPFDPRRSSRRFTIGAPDGIAAVALPSALRDVRREAPGVDVSVRDVQPLDILAALDAREIDIGLYPLDDVPARFEARILYEEDFVIAMRRGHPFGKAPSLKRYCDAQHLLVSRTGDSHGFVDERLKERGRTRRVALTLPSFFWALTMVSESDLLGALPRSLVAMHGARFGVTAVEPPADLGKFRIRAVAARAAMTDAGVAWLMSVLERHAPHEASPGRRRSGGRVRYAGDGSPKSRGM
jgi:DNA-binding transcriptional LysR family regulator